MGALAGLGAPSASCCQVSSPMSCRGVDLFINCPSPCSLVLLPGSSRRPTSQRRRSHSTTRSPRREPCHLRAGRSGVRLLASHHAWGMFTFCYRSQQPPVIDRFVAVEAEQNTLSPVAFFRNRTRSRQTAQVLLRLFHRHVLPAHPLHAKRPEYSHYGPGSLRATRLPPRLRRRGHQRPPRTPRRKNHDASGCRRPEACCSCQASPPHRYLATSCRACWSRAAPASASQHYKTPLDGADELDAGLASGVYSTFQQIGPASARRARHLPPPPAPRHPHHAIHTARPSVATTNAYALTSPSHRRCGPHRRSVTTTVNCPPTVAGVPGGRKHSD